ncbi:nucleotidyl transferase AbiEii/AbiGii toxin family protein [Pseudomonas nunensis]|uniref:Nucleotidyl transferase AbiEii/AbiGii toxin family protein n=1 Tax=Pseudomonas nunensis TaxID=2961896 RepID=A0ABY5EFV0_9PSED|nr:nucleotidyl transferase AbiEii/AbiGii toxin family protein [Pseudomonas nunensis]KPN87678.1 hypothetical protein AL066_25895 [Pseudomonas nunensis]MCL5228359.1 nucleotidyl transferase AbiEii/AbiGii toxin family protein [Pseudomonas nunensis]UTO14646.1 nucleotidyl transferase AbiEii/AbiGii toxin family protein [Pseudomonas nunensis]
MVKGLDTFRAAFAGYVDRYVLIGGVAASLTLEEAGITFRATRDLDIVLIIEALDDVFGSEFWEFVRRGGYAERQALDGPTRRYRFGNPTNDSYPVLLELFSRAPEGLQLPEGAHLTPLPVDGDISDLSAILLDDAYYAFIVAGRNNTEDLSYIGVDRLIPLKAQAWINLSRPECEEPNAVRKSSKHLKDIIILSGLLTADTRFNLPESIAQDLRQFLNVMPSLDVDMKAIGLRGITMVEVAGRIGAAFNI